jgi:hypothetical protein
MEKEPKFTYTQAHRKYYETHRDEIREKRKEYSREYSKKYYAEHKDKINQKRKKERETKEDLNSPA